MAFSLGKGLDKKAQQRIILSVIFGVLFLYVYFQFFLKSSLFKLIELNSNISKMRTTLVESESLVGRKSEMERELVNLERKMEKYKISLASRSDLPAILDDISRIANESRIKILKMEPVKESREAMGAPPALAMPSMPGMPQGQGPQTSEAVYSEVPVTVEASGGYHDLGVFINNLENAKNFMKVDELEIDEDSENMYRHKIDMVVVVYVLSEGAKGK